jgi:hypothetical protein
MDCPVCSTSNSNDALFCHHCAEPLTATALGMQRSKEARGRHTQEIELTEAVAIRLRRWGTLIASVLTAFGVVLGLALGSGYFNMHRAIELGTEEITTTINAGESDIHVSLENAKQDISAAQKEIPALKANIEQA